MEFQAIGRVVAVVADDNVTLVNPELASAQAQYASMTRVVRPAIANAVFRPQSPVHQVAGLAAYAVWLADLFGWDDEDWLHNG